MDLKLHFEGKLSGVDFTKAGEFLNNDNGEIIKYGSSVKLKFNYEKEITKNGIPTKQADTVSVKVPVEDNELEPQVRKFNHLIGKNISLAVVNLDSLNLSSFPQKIHESKSK